MIQSETFSFSCKVLSEYSQGKSLSSYPLNTDSQFLRLADIDEDLVTNFPIVMERTRRGVKETEVSNYQTDPLHSLSTLSFSLTSCPNTRLSSSSSPYLTLEDLSS